MSELEQQHQIALETIERLKDQLAQADARCIILTDEVEDLRAINEGHKAAVSDLRAERDAYADDMRTNLETAEKALAEVERWRTRFQQEKEAFAAEHAEVERLRAHPRYHSCATETDRDFPTPPTASGYQEDVARALDEEHPERMFHDNIGPHDWRVECERTGCRPA